MITREINDKKTKKERMRRRKTSKSLGRVKERKMETEGEKRKGK